LYFLILSNRIYIFQYLSILPPGTELEFPLTFLSLFLYISSIK
jgi:hypothetical protein